MGKRCLKCFGESLCHFLASEDISYRTVPAIRAGRCGEKAVVDPSHPDSPSSAAGCIGQFIAWSLCAFISIRREYESLFEGLLLRVKNSVNP